MEIKCRGVKKVEKVNLNNAFDLHLHSSPSLFERIGDDVEMARVAREAGMRGIMLKSHWESTVSRAYHTMKQVPGILVFGGITLNHHVGGINPSAVDAAVKSGAKEIWMPTYHSKAHADLYGFGKYAHMNSKTDTDINIKPISILDEKGKLTENILNVLRIVKKADVILATSHISSVEVLKLVKVAKDIGFPKILVTHAFFNPPGMTINDIKKAVDLGAFIEFCAGALTSPIPDYGKLEYFVEAIKNCGPNHIIISSDAGQARKPWFTECIRVFAQCLYHKGIKGSNLQTMMIENQKYLLNLNGNGYSYYSLLHGSYRKDG